MLDFKGVGRILNMGGFARDYDNWHLLSTASFHTVDGNEWWISSV